MNIRLAWSSHGYHFIDTTRKKFFFKLHLQFVHTKNKMDEPGQEQEPGNEEDQKDGEQKGENVEELGEGEESTFEKSQPEDSDKSEEQTKEMSPKFFPSKLSTGAEQELYSSDEYNSKTSTEEINGEQQMYYQYRGEEGGEELFEDICKLRSGRFYAETQKKSEVEGESGTSSDALSNVYRKLSPFTVKWSFGINKNVELINLTSSDAFEVFYVASHFGVIYNYCTNTMTFLPGHNYPITSIASDASGRWLVSADVGEDTVIIIWDNKRRLPVWTLFNVFPDGSKCVQISQDARFLAAINNSFTFTLKFWLWTYGREEPDGTVDMNPAHGRAKHIDFNHKSTEQFAVSMESRVIFCEWTKSKKLETFTPPFQLSKKKLGTFRETLFLDDNHTAITATGQGYVVVWCDVKFSEPIVEGTQGTIEKNYLKTVKIQQSGITSLRLCDEVIISSSEEGTILFHDQMLRLLYWVPKLKLDPLVSISFNTDLIPYESDPFSPEFIKNRTVQDEEDENAFQYEESSSDTTDRNPDSEVFERDSSSQLITQQQPTPATPIETPLDCTIEMRPFVIRDFIFLTTTGKMGYVSHRRKKVKYFLYETDGCVFSIDCNPHRDHIVVGNSQGNLILYDYIQKKKLLSVQLPTAITNLKYSRLGHILLLGLQNGLLCELDPLLLTITSQLEAAKAPIEKICFSPYDDLLAYYDRTSTVYVYAKKQGKRQWHFMGKYISHYKPIKDILFEENQESHKTPRLFTIGEDRMLVEYDMNNLEENKLKILSTIRIEQTAVPCCFTWLLKFYKTPQFLISNNEYKLKVIDAKTQVCQKTTLGPTADTPIRYMKVIPDLNENETISRMIYCTEKHLGLRILPPTGNPFEGMGIVAHPEKIVSVAISYDYKYVFTAGLNDNNVLMWMVNPGSVEVSRHLGGVGLEPFVSLIEGGPNSFLFKEIEDFFYYAQIIHQGEDPNLDRSVSKNLALCEIPDLYRSLGYYPTDYEIQNILYELKHLNYERTGEIMTEVTFDECIKAYLNHRPVNGISLEHINKALLTIADLTDPTDIVVERDELYKALEEKAEGMTHEEAVGYLCILLLPKDENNPIPPTLALSEFAEDVLGIDLTISEETVRNITHAFDSKAD